MASANRDDVLMDFQACTGIEDIESSIQILEENSWNLLDSINAVMPHLGSQSLPSEDSDVTAVTAVTAVAAGPRTGNSTQRSTATLPNSNSGTFDNPIALGSSPPRGTVINEPRPGASASTVASIPIQEPRWSNLTMEMNAEAGPSQPQLRQRFLNFSIEYRDRSIPLVVSDGDTVGKMKKILGEEVSLPTESLDLKGWKKDVTDRTVLRELHLPKENRLFLLTPEVGPTKDEETEMEHTELLDRLQLTFSLHINVDASTSPLPNSTKNPLKLQMPGSRTVREVMSDVYHLTNIPMRHQEWTGWPPECSADPSLTLAGSSIKHPIHELTLKKKLEAPNHATTSGRGGRSSRSTNRSTPDLVLSDDSDMEIEAPFCEDDFPPDQEQRLNTLIPDREGVALSETEATEHFSAEFISRYGDSHPVFFMGTLEDALRNSCAAPIRERRPLAIYLHHDSSVLANVFCSQILCAESVVNFLSNNYLTWGWDMTHESNRAKLLTMVTRHFGSVAASTIRNFKPDELPLLIVITRQRGINEVSTVIQGNSTLDELMMNLIASHEVFTQTIQVEMDEELQREEREQMRNEQELAFQESLAMDRAKEEAKREEENRAKEEKERDELMKIAEQKREVHEKELRTAIQRSIQDILPDEPPESTEEPLSKVRIRKPDGEFILRRFLASAPLKQLFQFTASKGFPIEEFKVLSSWPRRDLSGDPSDLKKTFQEMKLCPQETLFLEER